MIRIDINDIDFSNLTYYEIEALILKLNGYKNEIIERTLPESQQLFKSN